MTVITIRYLLLDRARLWRRDICAIGETRRYSRIFSPQRARPFLIPSCRVLNSPLLLLLLARTSRFLNYARVAYLTDGICPSLLLCSFLREPAPFPPGSSCPFRLGRKAGPVRSETLSSLFARALAIKRRPITIVIVIVITVVISKQASERVLKILRPLP